MKVLAVVDGSERTGRIVQYLLGLAGTCARIEVVLLNIQPHPEERRMRGYGWFHREEIKDRLVNELGARIVMTVSRRLEAAGIKHKSRIEIGDQVETITQCTGEETADLIVVPEREPGILRKWLITVARLPIGSVASVIVHLVPVPVVVVR